MNWPNKTLIGTGSVVPVTCPLSEGGRRGLEGTHRLLGRDRPVALSP